MGSNNSEMKRDDETGQFTPSVTEQDILDAMTPVEPHTAREVADTIGDCARRTVTHRLNDMADAGKIKKKKFAKHRVVYQYIPDEVAQCIGDGDAPQTASTA